IKQGIVLVASGVALGLLAAFAVTRLIASLLFGVGAADPTTFGITSLLLVCVAVLAGYLPARPLADGRAETVVRRRYARESVGIALRIGGNDGPFTGRFALLFAPPGPDSWLHAHRRPLPGLGHRRQHGDLQLS